MTSSPVYPLAPSTAILDFSVPCACPMLLLDFCDNKPKWSLVNRCRLRYFKVSFDGKAQLDEKNRITAAHLLTVGAEIALHTTGRSSPADLIVGVQVLDNRVCCGRFCMGANAIAASQLSLEQSYCIRDFEIMLGLSDINTSFKMKL